MDTTIPRDWSAVLPTNACKICGSPRLKFFAHTATCQDCGVLVNWPYVPPREENYLNKRTLTSEEQANIRRKVLKWHMDSGQRNHDNFTRMALFALSHDEGWLDFKAMDFGGGAGQFALVLRSLFPMSQTYLVDMDDEKLLDEFRAFNTQIPFATFDADQTKFDIIFMNDVFEHLTDPIGVLKMLMAKLKPNGRIFIDTPRKCLLYYAFKLFMPGLQTKVLRGTVDHDHQQIWSRKAFDVVAHKAGLRMSKVKVLTEFTQPAAFYLDGMGIGNSLARAAIRLVWPFRGIWALNKFMVVLVPGDDGE